MQPLDGFWLPQAVREQVLAPRGAYTGLSFARGQPCGPADSGAVTARWPVLEGVQWQALVDALRANRQRVPRGEAFWVRFRAALAQVARRLADPADRLHTLAASALPGYTGYSEAMIRLALGALDAWELDELPAAFQLVPTHEALGGWQSMGALSGRLQFYPARGWQRSLGRLPGGGRRRLFGGLAPPDVVVGYGAGNVPGTALLIAFLALASTLAGGPAPVVVVKNSRREPILAPLVLDALEAVDADLVSSLAVLIWDYQDDAAQGRLLSDADLVVAAASDETIAHIRTALDSVPQAGGARFHAHGHKVSFTAIGREVLSHDLYTADGGAALIDVVPLLAALDSIFWDQHGCLSSRIHFVETGGVGYHTPREYAAHLVAQLGLLDPFLPRGAWPRRRLHDRFDRYKLLEQTGQVQVLSTYDDEFVVIYDERTLDARALQAQVNECEGRVIVVRPVTDLTDIPAQHLALLPEVNLQSLSVAVGRAGGGLDQRFLRFARMCGARGVTAIRTVGRGAFPQLAYSWDGLIPLDLVRQRPAGRFTTIEFDAPYDEVLSTYRRFVRQGAALGLVPARSGQI